MKPTLKPSFADFDLAGYAEVREADPLVLCDWLQQHGPGGAPLELIDVLLLYAQYGLPQAALVAYEECVGYRSRADLVAHLGYRAVADYFVVGLNMTEFKERDLEKIIRIGGMVVAYFYGHLFERVLDRANAEHVLQRMVLQRYSQDTDKLTRTLEVTIDQVDRDMVRYAGPVEQDRRLSQLLQFKGFIIDAHRGGWAGTVESIFVPHGNYFIFLQTLRPIDFLLPLESAPNWPEWSNVRVHPLMQQTLMDRQRTDPGIPINLLRQLGFSPGEMMVYTNYHPADNRPRDIYFRCVCLEARIPNPDDPPTPLMSERQIVRMDRHAYLPSARQELPDVYWIGRCGHCRTIYWTTNSHERRGWLQGPSRMSFNGMDLGYIDEVEPTVEDRR